LSPSIKRTGRGRFRVRLGTQEVAVLRGLPEQLRSVLVAHEADPVLERLFPPAYMEPEDVDRDAEYHHLVHDDLLKDKLANLEVVTGTLERGTLSLRRWTVELSEDEAMAWLGALNDLRLALGVRLGITEDFDGDVDEADPRAPGMHLLSYLSLLEEHLVEALASG
jgi:hypothetical protein